MLDVPAASLLPPSPAQVSAQAACYKHWTDRTVTFCGPAFSGAKKTWLSSSPTLLLSPWSSRQWYCEGDQLYGLYCIVSCIALTQAPPPAGKMISRNKTAEIRCWPQPSPALVQPSTAPASVAWQCIAEWNRAPCTLAMVDLVFSFAYFSQCRTQHLSEKGDFSPWKSAWDSFLFILLSILGENVHLIAFFHATYILYITYSF